jgi:hypothetical protein
MGGTYSTHERDENVDEILMSKREEREHWGKIIMDARVKL